MGLLDGLEKFGLKNISTENMYEEPEKNIPVKEEVKAVENKIEETDFVFPKKIRMSCMRFFVHKSSD